jgi:hypothetical protein
MGDTRTKIETRMISLTVMDRKCLQCNILDLFINTSLRIAGEPHEPY